MRITGVTSGAVLIGKSGSMTTKFGAEECCERLRAVMRGFKLGSRVDSSGFKLAKSGRTAIRIRGTFVPQPGGSTIVSYRIEFLPVVLLALAITTPLGIMVLALGFWLAHQNIWEVWSLLPLCVLVIGGNLWISDRQAHWLVVFVRNRLEAS